MHVLAIYLVRLIIFKLKLYVQLLQGVLARGGDVAGVHEDECLEIRTLSCYFHHAGVSDVAAIKLKY